MRRPRYRKHYRRRSSLGWRFRRNTRVVGAVAIVGFLAAAVIGNGGPPAPRSTTAQLIDHVTRVRDGDTIVVGLIPIRIANLDCAESGTAQGERATRRMKQLVSGQTLACRLYGRRSYDREVAVCALPDGRDLGEVMIAEGMCKRWR